MDDDEIHGYFDAVEARIKELAEVSESVYVNNAGWLIALQVTVGTLIETVMNLSGEPPEVTLGLIRARAATNLRDSVHFPNNNPESIAVFRASASDHLAEMLGGITPSRPSEP